MQAVARGFFRYYQGYLGTGKERHVSLRAKMSVEEAIFWKINSRIGGSIRQHIKGGLEESLHG